MWKSINVGLVAAVMAGSTAVVGARLLRRLILPTSSNGEELLRTEIPAVRYAQASREQHATTPLRFSTISSLTAAPPATATWSRSPGPSALAGARVLSVSADTFSGGDVGKAIAIPGAGNGGGKLFAHIASFTNAQSVTLDRDAATGLSAASKEISYGTDDAPKFMAFNKWARENQARSRSFSPFRRGQTAGLAPPCGQQRQLGQRLGCRYQKFGGRRGGGHDQ